MTKDQLFLDAIQARAIELESPLSDEDAAAPRGGDFHTEGCPDAVDFRVPFSDQIFPCVPY